MKGEKFSVYSNDTMKVSIGVLIKTLGKSLNGLLCNRT